MRTAQDDRDRTVMIKLAGDHRDDDPLFPGEAYQIFDFRFMAAEPAFLAVFRQEQEPFEIAETVIDNAFDLAGLVMGFDFIVHRQDWLVPVDADR